MKFAVTELDIYLILSEFYSCMAIYFFFEKPIISFLYNSIFLIIESLKPSYLRQ